MDRMYRRQRHLYDASRKQSQARDVRVLPEEPLRNGCVPPMTVVVRVAPAGNVAAGPRGVRTGRDLRSVSNRRVWAVGDIADPEGLGPRAFTHVASQHAGIVVRSMLFRLPGTRLDYDALPRVTYTDPELAQIGLTEAEARESSSMATQCSR